MTRYARYASIVTKHKVFFVFVWFSILIITQPVRLRAQVVTLLWSRDLSVDSAFKHRQSSFAEVLRPPTVQFLNDAQLVVGFDDGLMSGSDPELQPFGFHVLAVNRSDGHLGSELSFTVKTDSSEVASLDSGFLVLTGQKLIKYSFDFREIAYLPVPWQPVRRDFHGTKFWTTLGDHWEIDPGASGDVFILSHRVNQNVHLEWRRADDLRLLQEANAPIARRIDAGQNEAILQFPKNATLLSPQQKIPLCDCSNAYFIDENTFYLEKGDRYDIVSKDGVHQFGEKLTTPSLHFSKARNADRIALANGEYVGHAFPWGSSFGGVEMDVHIINWKLKRQVAQVHLSKPVGAVSTGYRQSAIAISPNGKFLAILDDSNLRCYELP